jgi:hypothetical protein
VAGTLFFGVAKFKGLLRVEKGEKLDCMMQFEARSVYTKEGYMVSIELSM